ncbi:MAG: restriction endonuclease [Bryobacteraceae bacterium]
MEREAAARMLRGVQGFRLWTAVGSSDAREILKNEDIHCVVTDILRRNAARDVLEDDGYTFFSNVLRPWKPTLPVIFHTKNLPTTFAVDPYSQYLSKWDSEDKKTIELETRLSSVTALYEAYADESIWRRIEPRLVMVQARLLNDLGDPADVMRMAPDKFEQLVAELLESMGFKVLWIPGGKDQGIDIIAAADTEDFLIDVKRYSQPVGVELVRQVYGVACAAGPRQQGRGTHGGIITSSRFTLGAQEFRRSVRTRPLLRDGEWLAESLRKYAPRLASN